MVDLTFINGALTRVGSPAISSLDEQGSGPEIANQNYENVVLDELSRYPWKWATTTVTLGPPLDGTPAPPWLYARTLPYPTIRIRSVKTAGIGIKYEVQSDKLLADYDSSYDVIVTALWRRPEVYWPPYFGELIAMRMQQIFLRGIGERYAEAESLDRPIERQRAAARLADAQSQPPSDPWRYPTLEARVA